MGLLSVIESLNTATSSINKLQDSVIDSLRELPGDPILGNSSLAAPGILFKRLSEILEIHRGALFLYDVLENCYIPWASWGFDSTSLHRMKIPVETALALAGESSFQIPGSSVTNQLTPFFSARDYALLEKTVTFSYRNDTRVEGFLFLADAPFMDTPTTEVSRLLAELLADPFQIMLRERTAKLDKMNINVRLWTPDWRTPLKSLVNELSPGGFHLVIIDLDEIMTSIMAKTGTLEYAAKLDILKLLSSFLAGRGTVFDLPGRHAFVLIPDHDYPDCELIFHQTGMGIKSMLGADPSALPLPCIVENYKGEDPETIITRIAAL